MSNLNNNRPLKVANFYSKSILPRFEDVRGFTRPAILLRNIGLSQISDKTDNYYRINFTKTESRKFADTDLLKKYIRIEYDLTLDLLNRIDDNSVFYDIGGFQGYHTLLGSLGEKVYTFEPDPNNLEKLYKNIELNPEQEIEVIEKPVWSEVKELSLEIGKEGESSVGNGEIKKKSTTIDKFIFEENRTPPDIIKIDVEGAEQKVLEGAEKTLEKHSPEIFIEVHGEKELEKFESSEEDIDTLLKSKGYNIEKSVKRGGQKHKIYSSTSK